MDVGGVVILVTILFLLIPLRFIYGYRLSERGVSFMLFGRVSIWTIKYVDICEIKVVDFLESGVGGFTIRLGNKLMPPYVLIKKFTGVRKIIITPKDPEIFVSRVKIKKGQEAVPMTPTK